MTAYDNKTLVFVFSYIHTYYGKRQDAFDEKLFSP